MENMENSQAHASGRRATMFGNEIASDTSHLKTEVVLLQRKYERLQQKERRMQVLNYVVKEEECRWDWKYLEKIILSVEYGSFLKLMIISDCLSICVL